MLIQDLTYYQQRKNYNGKTNFLDSPDRAFLGREYWENHPVNDFEYNYNSWAFRGPEYDQYKGKPVNICLGDSFTANIGGPIEHSWCSQLALKLNIPTLNLGVDGAGNDTIRIVYERALNYFDVQLTFVMYSYFHRRLHNGEHNIHVVKSDNENFEFFKQNRLKNIYECALPSWCWSQNEIFYLQTQQIYFLDTQNELFSKDPEIDRICVVKESYNNLKGPDWPTYTEFINGADPHQDMFLDTFGLFLNSKLQYLCRDGLHMNYNANKIYADYLYQQWKQNNES